jgi:hypothetical protein
VKIGLFGYGHEISDASALTPALSPRRGGIVRRVLSHAIGWVILYLTVHDTLSVAATRIEKLSNDMRWHGARTWVTQ